MLTEINKIDNLIPANYKQIADQFTEVSSSNLPEDEKKSIGIDLVKQLPTSRAITSLSKYIFGQLFFDILNIKSTEKYENMMGFTRRNNLPDPLSPEFISLFLEKLQNYISADVVIPEGLTNRLVNQSNAFVYEPMSWGLRGILITRKNGLITLYKAALYTAERIGNSPKLDQADFQNVIVNIRNILFQIFLNQVYINCYDAIVSEMPSILSFFTELKENPLLVFQIKGGSKKKQKGGFLSVGSRAVIFAVIFLISITNKIVLAQATEEKAEIEIEVKIPKNVFAIASNFVKKVNDELEARKSECESKIESEDETIKSQCKILTLDMTLEETKTPEIYAFKYYYGPKPDNDFSSFSESDYALLAKDDTDLKSLLEDTKNLAMNLTQKKLIALTEFNVIASARRKRREQEENQKVKKNQQGNQLITSTCEVVPDACITNPANVYNWTDGRANEDSMKNFNNKETRIIAIFNTMIKDGFDWKMTACYDPEFVTFHDFNALPAEFQEDMERILFDFIPYLSLSDVEIGPYLNVLDRGVNFVIGLVDSPDNPQRISPRSRQTKSKLLNSFIKPLSRKKLKAGIGKNNEFICQAETVPGEFSLPVIQFKILNSVRVFTKAFSDFEYVYFVSLFYYIYHLWNLLGYIAFKAHSTANSYTEYQENTFWRIVLKFIIAVVLMSSQYYGIEKVTETYGLAKASETVVNMVSEIVNTKEAIGVSIADRCVASVIVITNALPSIGRASVMVIAFVLNIFNLNSFFMVCFLYILTPLISIMFWLDALFNLNFIGKLLKLFAEQIQKISSSKAKTATTSSANDNATTVNNETIPNGGSTEEKPIEQEINGVMYKERPSATADKRPYYWQNMTTKFLKSEPPLGWVDKQDGYELEFSMIQDEREPSGVKITPILIKNNRFYQLGEVPNFQVKWDYDKTINDLNDQIIRKRDQDRREQERRDQDAQRDQDRREQEAQEQVQLARRGRPPSRQRNIGNKGGYRTRKQKQRKVTRRKKRYQARRRITRRR
jgi:hypothetical protein